MGPNALTDFAEYATAIDVSQQAVTGRPRPTCIGKALVVEAESSTKCEVYPVTRLERVDTIALAEPGHEFIPPSRSPTASPEYSANEVASILRSSQSAPPDSVGFEVPMHSDTVNLVMGTNGRPTGAMHQTHPHRQAN